MRSWKTRLSLLVLILLAGLTLWLVLRGQDLNTVLDAIRRTNPWWLALGFVFVAALIGSEAAATKVILHATGHPLPYRCCYAASVTGFYFSSITPSSSGGQPAQVFYLARMGVPAAVGALDMLLISVCFQTVSLFYAVLAGVLSPASADGMGTGLGALLGYGFTVVTILTLAMLLFLFRPAPVRSLCLLLIRLGTKLRILKDPDRTTANLDKQMEEYARGAKFIRTRPLLFPLLMGLVFCQITFLYLIPWTVYKALGLTGFSLIDLLATQALLALAVGALPIPGAVGATEGVFLATFNRIFTPALTAPAMLLSRGISFYLPLLLTGAAVAVIHIRTAPKGPSETKSGPPKTG